MNTVNFRRLSILVPITVSAILACTVDYPFYEPSSACTVYDRYEWRDSGLGGSQVVQPVGPVVVSSQHQWALS